MKLLTGIVLSSTLLGAAAASAQGVEFYVAPSQTEHVYVDRDRGDWRDSRAQYRDRETVIIKKRHRDWGRDRDYDGPRTRTKIIERY